jgi:hypothetical protein
MITSYFTISKKFQPGKDLLFALLFSSTVFVSSCNTKKSEEGATVPEGMHVLNLRSYGKPFSIFVPDTVKSRLLITEQTTGALEVRVGKQFGISINEQLSDFDLLKKDLKEDEVTKFKSFIKEEDSALMWESEVVQPEYHFMVNKKIRNTEYSFEDIKSTEADPFSKDAIERMFDASKNVQPSEGDKSQ